MTNIAFTRLAGWAAIVTALTTIGVHYVNFQADTFEQRLALSTHTGYILHRWMIILHCLLVVVSMLGVGIIVFQKSHGLAILGFLGFAVFGFTEIARMFSVLEYLNPLRKEYLAATDDATRALLKHSIEHFQFVGFTLFAVFAFAFALGNLCYGLAMQNGNDRMRWIGIGFLYWAFIGIAGMVNEALQSGVIDAITDTNAKVFQPVFRLLIGLWLLTRTTGRPWDSFEGVTKG